MSEPRAVTITVEAKTDEHLQKLLELALFDLAKLKQDTWSRVEGETVPLTMAGDMGFYRLEYKLGSPALTSAHAKLLDEGYKRVETTEWETEDYGVYEHPELASVRLYLESARVTEHDVDDHEKRRLRF
ncbi:hypothetical protein LU646_26780 [Pseudomonas alloputida]|uniref:hypothetical protein n=1 Tax=Pseudomonas alloputida TaxID=1940621 RepID=UPI001E4299DF|nr:hypothetical protein [Pseudomonas alloputida]MCE1061455.1 hypothetical protein [Pseudomonas alloputida]